MFGQFLQKEKSISLPKAEIFTCKNLGGDQTLLPSARDGHKLHVGHPSEETRHHESWGWSQAAHGTPQGSRTWDAEAARFLPYHIRCFSNNNQSKGFIPELKSENDWSCVELKALGKMGF